MRESSSSQRRRHRALGLFCCTCIVHRICKHHIDRTYEYACKQSRALGHGQPAGQRLVGQSAKLPTQMLGAPESSGTSNNLQELMMKEIGEGVCPLIQARARAHECPRKRLSVMPTCTRAHTHTCTTKARHPSEAQRACHAAVQDGLCADSATSIARLGAWGTHVGNVERDFHRHVRAQGLDGSVEPYLVSTKVASKGGAHEDAQVPILLPHEIVNGIWRASPNKFQSRMVGPGGPSSLEHFWTKKHGVHKISKHTREMPTWDLG